MSPVKTLYHEDDFYDVEDEDDFYDDNEIYGTHGQTKSSVLGSKGGSLPAAARTAGASKMAQGLCGPTPLRPVGKPQKGAKREPSAAAKQQSRYPVVPPTPPDAVAAAGDDVQAAHPFGFNTPSPDDIVLAAQEGKPVEGTKPPITEGKRKSGNIGISLPQSKFLANPNPGQRRQQSQADEAASNMSHLNLASESCSTHEGASPSGKGGQSASEQPLSSRRRIGKYVMEPDLSRAVHVLEHGHSDVDSRQGLHLIVLGHVDAGKSTLMGRLLHDLGVLGKKEAHKNAKESAQAGKASFSWAWALDERPEERSRGVTVDIALHRFQTRRFNVTLMDAPGHRDFVPNMISGATQADAALLLVDGSIGGFEAGFNAGVGGDHGQTREHAQLARSLGVEQLAVVVSKLDMCDYSQDRFNHIKATMLPFLTKTCGFKETALQWLPAVGPSGQNLVTQPTEPSLAAWWSGPTVVAAVDHFSVRERLVGKPVRMPISDVFKSKTGAMALGGKLEGGALKVGSRVLLVPNPLNEVATVKSIDVDGHPCQVARAGDSADVVLSGIDLNSISSGAVLCHPDYPVPLVSCFEARLLVLEIKIPILRGHQVSLHAHTAREAARISGLISIIDPKSGDTIKLKPRCILRGQTVVVEVTPDRPMCLEEYSDYKALGRIALREGGKTIAVGIITRLLQ